MDKILFVVIGLLVLAGGFLLFKGDTAEVPESIDRNYENNKSDTAKVENKTENVVAESEIKVTDNNTVINLSNQNLTPLPPNTFLTQRYKS